MQYKSMGEQLETAIDILEQNSQLMEMLDYISTLDMPNYYIAAGAIFQTIWNYYDHKELNSGIKDLDVIYYDSSDLSIEKDLSYYHMIKAYALSKGFSYEIDVSNEARMHLWKSEHENKEIEQYTSAQDAICKWIATVHAIGITKENNKIRIYAPYGLSDIFSKTIRPIKHKDNSKELYEWKAAGWNQRFHHLTIIDW